MQTQDVANEIREAIPKPNRVMSPFMWYGGKGRMAKFVIPHIPKTKVYVEPFAGASSILFHREPSPVEVLNDLHSEIVCLFRVLQNREQFERLAHRLTFTLYSREEFRLALAMEREEGHSEVDRAWAFFVRQNQGFGGKATSEGDWGRAFVELRNMANTASKWRSRLSLLNWWHERLTRVQVDNCCALQCIKFWDSKDTCFYVDPPYEMETRAGGAAYKHEVKSGFHEQLLELLMSVKGQVVLSGYDCDSYAELTQNGFKEFKRDTVSFVAGRVRNSGLQGVGAAIDKVPRKEMLWVKTSQAGAMLF